MSTTNTTDSEIILADYIFNNDREHDDYQSVCNENYITPFDLRGRKPFHILEHAAIVLHGAGYDVEGWFFK